MPYVGHMSTHDEAAKQPSKAAGRPLGATGEAVRKNIRRIRDGQGISAPKLSANLKKLGRSIPPLGISRIESGDRRVDVDDLVAIALALGVSPISLLLPGMPGADDPGADVEVTGVDHSVRAVELWIWLKADAIAGPPSWASPRPLFEANGIPAWEWARWSRGDDGDD
jgi:transcriptional regulator with XRE-family HTH domain